MNVCSLNDVLPNGLKIKRITTGSELLFAYELDKYARLMLDTKISLKGIPILKQLYAQAEFSFVVSHNLDIGFEIVNKSALMDISSKKGYFFTDVVQGIALKSVTPTEWVYDFSYNTRANRVCYGMNRAAAYVSLVAFMIISSIANDVSCPKLVIDHENHAELAQEYVHLLILRDYGSKVLKDLIDIRFNKATGNQPEVEAFILVNRQRGYMNREYTTTEKVRHLKKNFYVGDIVLLYSCKKLSKTKVIPVIESCYPAVITGYDDRGINLTYYPNVTTKTTHTISIYNVEEEYKDTARTKGLISDADYARFPVCNVRIPFFDIGIDSCTYLEEKFLIKPIESDGTYQYFRTAKGYDRVFLNTIDTIYALFEDRGLWYSDESRERFIYKYFTERHKEPLYDKYKEWILDK